MSFLTEEILKGTDWRAFERAVARVLSHCGWRDVAVVGGSGDQGADIIGLREQGGRTLVWVVQVKAVLGGNYVRVSALNEAMRAYSAYGANVAAVATNGDFTDSAVRRQRELESAGFTVKLWNGHFLRDLLSRWPETSPQQRPLRPYQTKISDRCVEVFEAGGKRAQFIVATGLGKTMIAADVVSRLKERGLTRALVLCHTTDLALQLERSFWTQIGRSTPTRVFFGGEPPNEYEGINFGLYQTMQGYLSGVEAGTYQMVVVDEAHHAMALGFRTCIAHLAPRFLVGMTATPWRGDGHSIDEVFGEPLERVSLVDGMALGFLAQVDYRLFCDNVDWDAIPTISKQSLTIRDLNKRLFLPQRDEAVISEVKRAAAEVGDPRVAIFSPSIEHGLRFAELVKSNGIPCEALSGVDRVLRQKRLMDFAAGRLKAVTAVDLLNEGIDVPDVNILVFMRATHSRRIFVQQLGRGLRVSSGKKKVVVLDFVSDIRRMAEVLSMDREARERGRRPEALFLRDGFVRFSNEMTVPFIEAWLRDVADLGDAPDSERLKFPEGL